jgi:hypothetical protein
VVDIGDATIDAPVPGRYAEILTEGREGRRGG